MPKSLTVEFGIITKDNVEQLRTINTTSFPITYKESFYQDVVKRQDENYNKFAYWNGFVVGAACSRFEEEHSRLYIMTLAVLAAYRGRGIGSQLLTSILEFAKSQENIKEVALHVQISNTDALDFYEKKFGFTRGEMVENYYQRIDPPHCYLLYKKIDRD